MTEKKINHEINFLINWHLYLGKLACNNVDQKTFAKI